MNDEQEKMVSIWVLVGMILCLFGSIITGCGLYYASTGVQNTVMNETNPSLWWGSIILVSGIILLISDRIMPDKNKVTESYEPIKPIEPIYKKIEETAEIKEYYESSKPIEPIYYRIKKMKGVTINKNVIGITFIIVGGVIGIIIVYSIVKRNKVDKSIRS